MDWFIYALILATTASIISAFLVETDLSMRQFYSGLALMIAIFLLAIYCMAQGIMSL